jgi:hypothetical protein
MRGYTVNPASWRAAKAMGCELAVGERCSFRFVCGNRCSRCLRVSGKLAGMAWRTRLCRAIGVSNVVLRLRCEK